MPENDVSRSLLASTLGHLGRNEAAKEMWDELMPLNPEYSVYRHLGRLPFVNPVTPTPIVQGLRMAGLIT